LALEEVAIREAMAPGARRVADAIALGIGNNSARLRAFATLGADLFPALVHPRAAVARRAEVSPGTVVLAGAVVNPGAVIGRCAIVNSGAVVEHDCVIGPGCHISPGAVVAGAAEVGELAWIGAGAVVLPGIKVGPGAMVGAGAVVVKDVAPNVTVVGIPARVVPRRASGGRANEAADESK